MMTFVVQAKMYCRSHKEDQMAEAGSAESLEGFDLSITSGLGLSKQAEEYLGKRWAGEIRWFRKATRRSRLLFFWLTGISIVSSAITSLLAGVTVYSRDETYRWVVAIISLVTTVATGMGALFQTWANWKRRSLTLERLTSEARMFFVLSGGNKDYKDHSAAFPSFAEKIEQIVREHKTEVFAEAPRVRTSDGGHGDGPKA
jgi:hypothetical protein